jgi:hypothetical protein
MADVPASRSLLAQPWSGGMAGWLVIVGALVIEMVAGIVTNSASTMVAAPVLAFPVAVAVAFRRRPVAAGALIRSRPGQLVAPDRHCRSRDHLAGVADLPRHPLRGKQRTERLQRPRPVLVGHRLPRTCHPRYGCAESRLVADRRHDPDPGTARPPITDRSLRSHPCRTRRLPARYPLPGTVAPALPARRMSRDKITVLPACG